MSIKDMIRMENQLDEVADKFGDMMKEVFDEDPKIFEGRSTKASWNAQVDHASDELRKELNAMIEKFETRLHYGEFA
jgi:uncharacterized coiled-coil protein SlyX